ncbi:MAG: RecX family transcriptional regulator [Bacteroidota bacterium]
MIITAIERQKGSKHRVNIFIDGKFTLGIHESVFSKFGLHKGDSIDRKMIRTIKFDEEINFAKEKALRLISYRLRSEKELRERLTNKDITPDIVDETIQNLRKSKLVDDKAFARAYVHDLLLKKAAGTILLRRELRKKGIANDIIRETLDQMIEPGTEQQHASAAASALLKRYKTSRKSIDNTKRQLRIKSFLLRRGYDFFIINKVMRELFSNQKIEETDEQ